MTTRSFTRRDFIKATAAAGAAAQVPFALAQGAGAVNFHTWSAAVDTVKSHVSAFEKATGIKVAYSNSPWAQYRDTMITKFVSKAPLDVMWVSDTWLPEWVEAGWLAPIDKRPELVKYNAEVEKFCTDSMTYKGRQYGLTYYTDFMGFFYDEDKLKKAGIASPPKTWDEVVQQSLRMKQAGVSEYPLMLAMANESWLVEFISALVFSHGGRMVSDAGQPVMHNAKGGALEALRWVVDAVSKHKIVSPACAETGELNGLKAFTSGNHAFALLPKYRIRTLNDAKQSQIAGRAKLILMPAGPNGSHATVGWMRFYGISTAAAANRARFDNAAKLVEWFGGKAEGNYQFQKLLFLDIGAGFGQKSLYQDPDVRAAYDKYSDVKMVEAQSALARKKDVISPWFGEWNDVNGAAWQSAILGKATPEAALKRSADFWAQLKRTG